MMTHDASKRSVKMQENCAAASKELTGKALSKDKADPHHSLAQHAGGTPLISQLWRS